MKTPKLFSLLLVLVLAVAIIPAQNAHASSVWTVKYYSDPNICSSADCNPSQVYYQQENNGPYSVNYPSDGRVNNQGTDHWGSIWKGTENFPDGNYVLFVDHDDGVNLFINGQSVMDVSTAEMNHTCPAIHLSGNTDIVIIHKNTGGQAHLNLTWTKDTSICTAPTAYNVWVTRDPANTTVTVDHGDLNRDSLIYQVSGQAEVKTKSLWYSVPGGIAATIPTDAEKFMVDNGYVPAIGAGVSDLWRNQASDSRWVIKKHLILSMDQDNQPRLTYTGEHGRPVIRYTVGGVEATTSTYWFDKPDGSGIEAIIPQEFDVVKIDSWIAPELDSSAAHSWLQESYWLTRKTIKVWIDQWGVTYVTYYHEQAFKPTFHYVQNGVEKTTTSLWSPVGDGLQLKVPDGTTKLFVEMANQPRIDQSAQAKWQFTLLPSLWIEKFVPVLNNHLFIPLLFR